MNDTLILRRERQVSPRFNATREELRQLARWHNVKRGRNTMDTLSNLLKAGIVELRTEIVIH